MALLLAACTAREPPPAPPPSSGAKKPRVEITLWLRGRPPADDPLALALPAEPPPMPRLVERGGITLGVIGLPPVLSGEAAIDYLEKSIPETHVAGADATVVVTPKCLQELAPVVLKNRGDWWRLALVAGPACGERVTSPIGVTALVDSARTQRVRISFDRNSRGMLKVTAF
jgi:hypothetical protein